MSKGKVFLGIAAGLLAIYVAAGPYIVVQQIRSAAEERDGEALSEHVEFPSVRQSIKDQVNAEFAKQMVEDQSMRDNPFAALGAAFAGVMVDKMVDAYITPAGITRLMAGEKPAQNSTIPGGEEQGQPDRKPLADAAMAYESLDKFVVKVKNEEGGEGRFILRRRGFVDWKLTEIIVPL